MLTRGSGILIHVTSLPSRFGIGDLGPWAYKFVDFLAESKQSFWQILPLTVTNPGHHSPYNSPSAFACNPLLISPEFLLRDGYVSNDDLGSPDFRTDQVDYSAVEQYKTGLLWKAFWAFKRKSNHEYELFIEKNRMWLDDFAIFMAYKKQVDNRGWNEWPYEIRDRHPEALKTIARDLSEHVEMEKFVQFTFHKQWTALFEYCKEKSIQLIGDIPIYVDFDSADVWCHPQYFKLDENKRPYAVGGVPPDYFSETGQLWGVPIYQWDTLEHDGFNWWIRRLERNLSFCQFLRIDHFRGLVGYWEVPAYEQTAINGRWIDGPAERFFKAVLKKFPKIPLVAEDLGIITPDVREVMRTFELPGMKVLLFSFGDDQPTNPYTVHNFEKNYIAYTGTHDTNTVRGWFDQEASPEQKRRVWDYLGRNGAPDEVHWDMIRLVMMSVAAVSMFPMQDVLGLGSESRMNFPSVKEGNWRWRLLRDQLTPELAKKLAHLSVLYGRA